MKDTTRALILASFADDLVSLPCIAGVIDDEPRFAEHYESPPRPPRAEWGQPALPFAFVFEMDEACEFANTLAYTCTLPVRVEVAFRYARDPRGLKGLGRDILGDVQEAIHADPGRGKNPPNSTRGNAYRTIEKGNSIVAAPSDGIGVVIVDWEIQYYRNFRDPTSRSGQNAYGNN